MLASIKALAAAVQKVLRDRDVWHVMVNNWVYRGAPHFLIVLPNGRNVALFVRRKDGSGAALSEAQAETYDFLERAGWRVVTASDMDEVIGALEV